MELFQKLIDLIKDKTGTTSDGIAIAMIIVGIFIIIFASVGLVISFILWLKYHKLNKTKNSCGLTGEEAARRILDNNGLQHIKVKCTGSILWGNSYSHVFKKVRLRRFTYKKDSVTSLAMAAQKSALAVMDKEKDPIMKTRNVLIPLQLFGPLMFIPLVVIGVIIDLVIVMQTGGTPTFIATFISAGLGLLFYIVSFALTVVILKAETKAQARSIEILKDERLATDDEIESIKELYKLYNLEYINNMIMAFLELLMRILQIVAAAQGSAARSND